MYAGLSILFFFLVIYLQQVAGYTRAAQRPDDGAGDAGHVRALAPVRRARRPLRAAAVHGRRPAGRRGGHPAPPADGHARLATSPTCCPALLVFSLGLSMTVAPLTAAVLADADETDAGIASAINNAIARVAGLIGVSVVGVVVASTLTGDTFAPNAESVRAFHEAIIVCAALVAAGGVAGAIGISNPSRTVRAEACPGGQLAGVPAAVSIGSDQPGHDSRSRLSLAHDIEARLAPPRPRPAYPSAGCGPPAPGPPCEWGCAAVSREGRVLLARPVSERLPRRVREDGSVPRPHRDGEAAAEGMQGRGSRRRLSPPPCGRPLARPRSGRLRPAASRSARGRTGAPSRRSRRHRGAELARASVARLIVTAARRAPR